MESFHRSPSTPSSPAHTSKAPRASSRRSKDFPVKTSSPSSPPPSVSPVCASTADSSPSSSELKFRVSLGHNGAYLSHTPAQSNGSRDERGSKRAHGCEKFKSMQALRERSDDRERVSDREKEKSEQLLAAGKRSRTDDPHNRCNGQEKSSKSVMKEEKGADGLGVSVAGRKHARFDKRDGHDRDNRSVLKGSSCLQAEPSALHKEDLQDAAKKALRSSPVRDPGAQMDVDKGSPKEKKPLNVSRLPLKKAFKTLRALNEVGNSRDGSLLKNPEHGLNSGGESTGARKRASPAKPCLDDGEHNGSSAELGAQEFPINFSHISKKARSHRERRSHEKVGIRGGGQECSEGKPEEARKYEGSPPARVNSDVRVEGETGADASVKAGVSSGGLDTTQEEGNLEMEGTLESREVQLGPDEIVPFGGDAKEEHAASPEGAKPASDQNSVELVAGIAMDERSHQGAYEKESQRDIRTVRSDKDGMMLDRVYERKEDKVVQEFTIEEQGGKRMHSEVCAADGAISSLRAVEVRESAQRGSMLDFLDKGSVGIENHANQISAHKEVDTSNKQVTLSLFAKSVVAEGFEAKELTLKQDLQKEKFFERAQACFTHIATDVVGKAGAISCSPGNGESLLKSECFQLSLALPGTSNVRTVSHTSNAKGLAVAPARSFQSPSQSAHTQTHTQNLSQTQNFSQSQGAFGHEFASSFSQSLHNPSCSLDCTSLDNQELSCGGSKQWSEGNANFSQRSRQTVRANERHGSVSLSQDGSKHRPGITVHPWNLQNGSMHGFSSASGSKRMGENNDVVQRNRVSEQKLQVDSKILQDPKGTAQQHIDLSGRSSAAALHLSAAKETRSELLAQTERERVLQNSASPPRRLSNAKIEDARGDRDIYGENMGLHEIVTEPVAGMAQKMQELPDSFLEGLKGLAKDLIGSFAKRDEFLTLQSIIKSRTDLTEHTLLHAQQTQLEILVAFKTGLQDFVQAGAKPLTYKVLTEIFLQTRCRNTSCLQSLPVDGCECKICTEKKGFCHDCMCVVCTKFDSDNQTCRWVGCDVCMHWCHTDCGLRMSYITSARSSQDAGGSTEMQYQCVACGHHSELFGFVKGVFHQCADSWGAETLTKELDCVRRIFHGSGDARGKQLCRKVEELLQKLEKEVDTAEIRRSILQYFNDANANQGSAAGKQPVCTTTNELTNGRAMAAQEAAALLDGSGGNKLADDMACVLLKSYERKLLVDKSNETAELQVGKSRKRAEIESMVRVKQAEADMLQRRADEAHQEARGLQQIIVVKQEKIEGEYVCKYAKLKLNEAQEKRRRKFMELQALERAHLDYERMKQKIEAQIKDLSMKMEMANWQYA